MHSNSVIQYYVISLIEGNIDLLQKVWYQVENIHRKSIISNIIIESPVHRPATEKSITAAASRNKNNHNNMNIEYLSDGAGVRKYRDDVVIIPCIEEFNLRGRFYTLNRQALTRAYRKEDFLLRIDIDVKSSCDIDILDMFLICVSILLKKKSRPHTFIVFCFRIIIYLKNRTISNVKNLVSHIRKVKKFEI